MLGKVKVQKHELLRFQLRKEPAWRCWGGGKEGKTESEGGSQGSYGEEGSGQQRGLRGRSWSCVGFDSGCDGIPSAAVWRVACGRPQRAAGGLGDSEAC